MERKSVVKRCSPKQRYIVSECYRKSIELLYGVKGVKIRRSRSGKMENKAKRLAYEIEHLTPLSKNASNEIHDDSGRISR